MGKIGTSVIFLIALIIGLSLGFALGAASAAYAGVSFISELIEEDGLTINIDMNETVLGDHMFSLVEDKLDEMKEETISELTSS